MGKLKIGKYSVEITNPNKILFPEDDITKEQIIEYYNNIAQKMLPYTKDRAVTMHRFPQGIENEGFYHKDAPEFFPEWIKLFPLEAESKLKIVHYVVINNAATLVYLANYGCITPHLWLSKIDKPEYPDKIVFDIDPPNEKQFKLVCETAIELKKMILKKKLKPFVMTTGSKGLHVVIPIKRKYNFDIVRDFANQIALILINNYPDHLTTKIRKDQRENKIFIDVLRNSFGATSVAPYAVRARNGAPVATPIEWDELEDSKMSPQKYNIFNVFNKIKKKDPWKDYSRSASSIKL